MKENEPILLLCADREPETRQSLVQIETHAGEHLFSGHFDRFRVPIAAINCKGVQWAKIEHERSKDGSERVFPIKGVVKVNKNPQV